MRDFKARATAWAMISIFVSPLSSVNSQAARVSSQLSFGADWAEGQMAKMKDQTSLIDAFKRVEKLTGYRIMYSFDDVKDYKAQATPSSKDIHKALAQVLGKLPLEFSINGKFVSITPKTPTIPSVSFSSNVKNGETVVLQGRVVDENGDPLRVSPCRLARIAVSLL